MTNPNAATRRVLLSRASIRTKLLLLAGAPALGALVLAMLIVRDAQQRARSTAALGSVEDVARISVYMGDALRQIQLERATSARSEGIEGEVRPALKQQIAQRRKAVDGALGQLERFLASRKVAGLPDRLGEELNGVRRRLRDLPRFRARLDSERVPLSEVLDFFDPAAAGLVQATGALTELSDDGELLRSITALVAMLELEERSSREHALLAHVFEAREFPPGAFKTLVTLVTEEDTHAGVFLTHASRQQAARYRALASDEQVRTSTELRKNAIETDDETIQIDPERWFTAQTARLERLGEIERAIVLRIGVVAREKSAQIQSALRTSFVLSALILGISALLAALIARTIRRSLGELGGAAEQVRKTKDYSIRALKSTSDEIGLLADAFNEMLAGIEDRDRELAAHRENLEALVTERTEQLATRNAAMRLVLDHVEQGLATIQLDGTLDSERSRAFDEWFGPTESTRRFWEHVPAGDERATQMMELGWEMVVDNALPPDVALDQLPKHVERDGRYLTLRFRPLSSETGTAGALLIVSDVTGSVRAQEEQDRQREQIAIFEHISQDRAGFIEFFDETVQMLEKLRSGALVNTHEAMVLTHTIKGNAAQYGVTSVARIAHDLETSIVDSGQPPTPDGLTQLSEAWQALATRVRDLLGQGRGRVEMSVEDVDELAVVATRSGSAPEVLRAVERLKREPVAVRFSRMSEQVAHLAVRFGKPRPQVVTNPNLVRLPASRFGSFWSSLVHVLRNIMDHGIESPQERLAAGKPEHGTITMTASVSPNDIVIEIADDGRGIDWTKVADRAKELGVPYATRHQLERALLGGGVSTKDEVSDVSGRGVGLSAVAERCAALGGTTSIESTSGLGTRFRFRFPLRGNELSLAPSGPQARAGFC